MVKPSASLAPGFLLASPPLGDPNFDRTVVLLALHNEQGALGFVVNRPAPMTLSEFFSYAGYGEIGDGDPMSVLVGGPVQPTSGWILCVDPLLHADASGVLPVGDCVRITSSRAAFDTLAKDVVARSETHEADLKRRSVLLGYSGWGPGQLEGEVAAGAWLPVELHEDVLFDVEPAERWARAFAAAGVNPAFGIAMRSGGEA